MRGWRGEGMGNHIKDILYKNVCCVNWKERFPRVVVQALPETKSDLYSILIFMKKEEGVNPNLKPFRFEIAWMQCKVFDSFITIECISINYNLLVGIFEFKEKLKIWNKTIFGNINLKNIRTMTRLNGIQKKLWSGPNLFLQ